MKQNLTSTKITRFGIYQKVKPIKAIQIDTSFIVNTLEGTFEGKAGDWLAEGIEGERYIIDNAIFNKTYKEVV